MLEDTEHRACGQLREQVNHGNEFLHFSRLSGDGPKIYLKNSLRNPLQQVPHNEFQIPVLFLANIYSTPMDFVGAVLFLHRDGDGAVVSSTWGDIVFQLVTF